MNKYLLIGLIALGLVSQSTSSSKQIKKLSSYESGLMYLNGENVTQNIDKAIMFFTQSCDANISMGCDKLDFIKDNEEVLRKSSKEIQLYTKACDDGNFKECTNLGLMYLNDIGHARDIFNASMLFTKACNAGHPKGCTELGLIKINGIGGTKNIAAAHFYFSKACNTGDDEGCYNLNKILKR